MRVGVGFSDNPETVPAGRQAAAEAMARARRDGPCDFVWLFSTARHDPYALRRAVTEVVGDSVRIVGGGAVGAITNDRFGYAGDQIVLACVWLDGVTLNLVTEGGLLNDETEVGRKLGKSLAAAGTKPETPVMLFYDAIDRSGGGMRMVMATYLLRGLEEGLGFLPDLNGAGLMGDYSSSPTMQWIGDDISQHNAIAMVFGGGLRIDSVIMHGCYPSTSYYTVTKADRQTILEIDGKPALAFVEEILQGAVPTDNLPFFLILGVNKGDKWGRFDESSYASRLCLDIDRERSGIVMFEPDMVQGTEFQIMFRSLNLDYMPPRIEGAFERLGGREPVLALYINCAGRAAGYGGVDIEDAIVVQDTVADRVPILGIYTGVEIAAIMGRPRGLDWTGVFCLFSVPRGGGKRR
jgi:hypothetical protein